MQSSLSAIMNNCDEKIRMKSGLRLKVILIQLEAYKDLMYSCYWVYVDFQFKRYRIGLDSN